MFVHWDTDNNGSISYEELNKNLAEIAGHFQLEEAEVMKMMRKADTN